MTIRLASGKEIPIEMHKVRIVQKIHLRPVQERLRALEEAGYNTFLLRTRDIFLDMLTDSGVNAMSDNQLAGMMVADDAYAGGESYYRLVDAVQEVLGYKYVLPAHQGRAAEHLIDKVFLKPGQVVPTNYHFTTTRAHIEILGGTMLEIYADEALNTQSTHPFKGNIDIQKLQDVIKKYGPEKIAYVRMEATTNLLGGQPFSLENMRQVRQICDKHGLLLVLDGSLISENAYLIRQREQGYAQKSVAQIIKEMCALADIYYMSARKNTSVRGGMIATNNEKFYLQLRDWLPVYEGFLTYGGMSVKEVEAMAIGLREMVAPEVAGCAVEQVKYFANRLLESGVPVVTPPGGLACHLDARRFLPHIPQQQYPAGALAAAVYLASGIRTMERGTISTDRDPKTGKEILADLELTRIAVPRRVYTISHIEYAVDRISWLYKHRDLVKGLKFVEEPPVLRFFFGKLTALENWSKTLSEAFQRELGDY
uniref:Tryptophanase n=2 Tax=Candidatus Bipolaricaulota TaxID=67810 RepID=H5SJ99_9BACT|nr:tryptophanase [uncultured Acetothermia bacterium]BAL57902.1 tryptophanase [uncultured Acetothermia bacterium]BAL59025.1 tryptophanase [Candidatus Acetothermum autotrophicum]